MKLLAFHCFLCFLSCFLLCGFYSGSGAIGFAFTMVMQFLIGKRVNEKRFGFINTSAEKACSTESVSGRCASYYDHSNAKLISVDCRSGMITFTRQQSLQIFYLQLFLVRMKLLSFTTTIPI